MFGTVKAAADMGASAVGATIYFGSDQSARQIVEVAQAAAVHVEHNDALAQSLSQLELDQQIPKELYRAVAEVMQPSITMRSRIESERTLAPGCTAVGRRSGLIDPHANIPGSRTGGYAQAPVDKGCVLPTKLLF